MGFPSTEAVEETRSRFKAGARVVLDQMEDMQSPPVGTQGTCQGVDDTASVLVAWDNGSSLNVLYGIDRCHTISTEDEAKVTLEWYGKHQPEEDARCPRCGHIMWGPKSRQALSRYANIMVCSRCGQEEALECAGLFQKTPLMKWCACVIPQVGGGKWKR